MIRQSAIAWQLALIGICMVAAAQTANGQQRRHGHHHPRSGVPTAGGFSLGDSIIQSVSWLSPAPVHLAHHSRYGRHAHRHAPTRRGYSHDAHAHDHAHARHHGDHRVAHETHVVEEDLAIRMDVVEPVSHDDEVIDDVIVQKGDLGGGCLDCHPSGACETCCLIPFPVLCWDNLEVGLGVQGFTGPVNRGETGSFGINTNVNWGTPMPILTFHELGGQFGFRVTQSNFSGAEFTRNERAQFFLTTGVFHRVDWGFQGGLVVDYLRDDWYMESDLTQLRGELSWVFPCTHEWGFWFAANVRDDNVVSRVGQVGAVSTINETFVSTDVYAFFYRYRSDDLCGEARGYAGFTGESDGLIGADFRIPVAPRWDIDCGFAYLVPEESSNGGHAEESWNLSMSMVWHPGCRTSCDSSYYRPLFDVAGNGSFFVDRR